MDEEECLYPLPSPFHNGRFILDSLLGRGGMAEVYGAYDQGLGRWRAIKIMLPDYVRKKKLRARFETEARAMALLEHRNIVRVYDVGTAEGAPYIIMEICPGGSLEAWLIDKGVFAPTLAVECVLQTCAAIQAAHDAGVIHRDVKSQNILVGADGQCKVTDFGIAQTEMSDFTQTGSTMGTLGFMAPEQRSDAKKVDNRSDVYSLGATLYNLLTARVPTHLFAAEQDDEIMAGLNPDLLRIIKRATEYKREARYQSVGELMDALTDVRAALPEPAPGQLTHLRGDYTPPPVPRLRRPTPEPAPVRPASAPVAPKNKGGDYVIEVPPALTRPDVDITVPPTSTLSYGEPSTPPATQPAKRDHPTGPLRAVGAHQPPPKPADLFRAAPQAAPRTAPSRPPAPSPQRKPITRPEADPAFSSRRPRPSHQPTPPSAPPSRARPSRPPQDHGIAPHPTHHTNSSEPGAPARGYREPSSAGVGGRQVTEATPTPWRRASSDHPRDRPPVTLSTPAPAPHQARRDNVLIGGTLEPHRGPSATADDVSAQGATAAKGGFVTNLITDALDTAMGPARYLIFALLVFVVAGLGVYWMADRAEQHATEVFDTSTTRLLTGLDRDRGIMDDLITAGADSGLIQAHLDAYNNADTPRERAIAASELIRLATDQVRLLGEPTEVGEVRRRRTLKQTLSRLSDREVTWREADHELTRRRSGFMGALVQ